MYIYICIHTHIYILAGAVLVHRCLQIYADDGAVAILNGVACTATHLCIQVYYGITSLAKLAVLIGRSDDAAMLTKKAATMKAAMNARQFNGTAFCDGLCSDPQAKHTGFHANIYALAFGAVADENIESAFNYVKARINHPFPPPPPPPPVAATDAAASASSSDSWPPPAPMGGMPCGVYPSQFAVQALYADIDDSSTSFF